MSIEKIAVPSQSPTTPQQSAILHEGSPLLIIAGPGSGKTKVVSWRVAYLIRSKHIDPEKILVLTFTKNAALELKDRIQDQLADVNTELMQISTFHSFCAELLRRFGRQTGHLSHFKILDENGQFLFIYGHRKTLGLDKALKGRPNDFYRSVIATFNHATEERVKPDALLAWIEDNLCHCSEKDSPIWQARKIVGEAYAQYRQLLEEELLLDFASLQEAALELLEKYPDLLAMLRSQYDEILVDEYQDTNALQEAILSLLCGDGRHLTVVGDDDQSIYRFRGATVRNILEFEKRYPGAQTVKLVHNFRSFEPIIQGSQHVIAHNPARYEKELIPVRGSGSEVYLVYQETAEQEANAVVQMLLELHQKGKISHWKEVAVLLRSVKSFAAPYCESLSSAGIPFQVIGDASFFSDEVIQQLYDLLSFLSASKPWGDRFLRHPLVGLKSDTNESLKAYKENLLEVESSAQLIALGIKDITEQTKLLKILQLKRRVQAAEHTSILEVFYDLLSVIGCVSRFEKTGQIGALSNLGIFSRLISDWDENSTTNNFYPFQEYLKMIRDGGLDPYLPPMDDALRIMTIHQAKGLEFPVVVLGAAMNGRLPAARRSNPYDEIPDCLCASGKPEVDDPHLVDERKLFYVAATRAQDLLIVGTADVVNKRGGGPSPFLTEMFGPDLRAAADQSLEKIQAIQSTVKINSGPRPRHSYSELALFLDCPFSYKLAYIYGFARPTYQMILFGANIHFALESIHRDCMDGHVPDNQEIPGIVEQTWVSTPKAKPAMEKEMQKTAVRFLQKYVQDFHQELLRVDQAEIPFSFDLSGHVISGQIDLLRREGDRVEIVDFKTSPPHQDELERDAFQLGLYGLGVAQGMKRSISDMTVHFIGKEQTVKKIPWDETGRIKVNEQLTGILQNIDDEKFTPNPKSCHNCQEFSTICPYRVD